MLCPFCRTKLHENDPVEDTDDDDDDDEDDEDDDEDDEDEDDDDDDDEDDDDDDDDDVFDYDQHDRDRELEGIARNVYELPDCSTISSNGECSHADIQTITRIVEEKGYTITDLISILTCRYTATPDDEKYNIINFKKKSIEFSKIMELLDEEFESSVGERIHMGEEDIRIAV
jgi:hypothetical protein